MTTPALTADTIRTATAAQQTYMRESLARLVAEPSMSGHEHGAASVLHTLLAELGLAAEKLYLDTSALQTLPLFSCPCNPDAQRYNLLACWEPPASLAPAQRGKAVLFNGHMDVVPTGPHTLWSHPPFALREHEGWLYGRGAGDMKAGLICALAAIKTLQDLGLRPAAKVGFNAVVDEEDTGNGTLGTINALQSPLKNALNKARLTDFDTVVIPEPFGEALLSAQVGVCWLTVQLTGRPAHVAYMNTGLNPIEAGMALMGALKQLQDEMNHPTRRHPAFAHVEQPININLGRIEGGEWNSSVPCTCTLGIRCAFYPDESGDAAVARYSAFIRDTLQRLSPALQVQIHNQGFKAPGCVYDLQSPGVQNLMHAYEAATGQPPQTVACTATTDGRHFRLMSDMAVAVFGPHARNIHGIDECVSLESMQRVTQTLVHFIARHCGVVAGEVRR